jgi:hypothetical protein
MSDFFMFALGIIVGLGFLFALVLAAMSDED